MHARSLCAPQQRPQVLGVLERVQDKDERRLVSLDRAREDVVERGEPAGADDERHTLVAVEPRERGQRTAFDLYDRDPQARRVEDQLLERVPALWRDQQPVGAAARDEGLLDGAPPGDELLVLGEGFDDGGGFEPRPGRTRRIRAAALRWTAVDPWTARPGRNAGSRGPR